MDSQQIETLLERYWACETTLEEEKWLKNYFSGGEIPGSQSAYVPFFVMQEEKSAVRASENLSRFLENLPKEKRKTISMFSRYFYPALRIAASVLILVAVGLGIQTHHQNEVVLLQVYTETYSDPEMAMEEVYQAFDKIGISMVKAQTVIEGLTAEDDTIHINFEQE